MSLLLPEGISHLGDCPFPLHQAILTGLRLLGYEEHALDERPPKRIWMDGPRLTEWWDDVNRKWEEKFGKSSGSIADEYDVDGPDTQYNDVSLVARG